MILTNKDALAFAKQQLNTFNLKDFKIDTEIALNSLSKDIVEEFNELNLEETKIARIKHFQFPNVVPEDFTERILDLGEERKIIFGIRHEGGNRDYPFVKLDPNFELAPEDCRLIYDQHLKDYFKMFKPIHLRFWSSSHHKEHQTGSCYLVTTISELQKIPERKEESLLSFVDIQDDSYYPWYLETYQKFNKEVIELSVRVTGNSKETMKSSIDDGLLKYVFLGEKRIGLIAGVRSSFLGHDGVYFNDILIDSDFKGQGLAKSIQKKFLQEFSKPDDFVFGTIDYQNKPSFQTAVSNGRRAIRFETFVAVD